MGSQAGIYDRRTIGFHWATAVLVLVQFLLAWNIDNVPRGPLRVDVRSLHVTGGLAVGLVVIARAWWRLRVGRRLPATGPAPLRPLATLVHGSLYGLLLAMVTAGVLLAWSRGDSLFNLVTLPQLAPGEPALRHQIGAWHATIGWIIIAVVAVHVAAVLMHQYLLRDGLLRRMMPVGMRLRRAGRVG